MNFLGHLFLSIDGPPLVIVGNFMADAVKGRDLSRFHPELEHGIRLHRAIDTFTDQHPMQRIGRDRVRKYAGRYSGVVMDLFYDHLLAAQWHHWHTEPLPVFAQHMYKLLHTHHALLPERTRAMLPYMVQGDWLSSYATLAGIGRALNGLSQRAREGSVMAGAEQVLAAHMDSYRSEFNAFLSDIKEHLKQRT